MTRKKDFKSTREMLADMEENGCGFKLPEPTGWLIFEPTWHGIAVYKPISWFHRVLLRLCFGLKFVKK